MKIRSVVLIAVVCTLLGVGFGASMQPKSGERPRAQVTHHLIDTHTLSRFLDCYCHDISIQKDAIAAYTMCELQVVRPNGQAQSLWKDNKLELDEDGAYKVVVMMKPSDRSKSFNTSPNLDIYFRGMTQSIENPFFGLLKEKGIAIVKGAKPTDGELKLFEWEGKSEATVKLAFK